jgi:hypothetical protein
MQIIPKKFLNLSFITVNPAEKVLQNLSQKRTQSFLLYLSFSLLFFGFKLWVIYMYGNATPFWDQWDGEAINLYKPLHNGNLGWNNLLAPHNEHRIFTTRILAVLLLKINEIWNPILQMVVNAGLHLVTLIVAISLLARVTGQKYLPALLFFSLILFAIPFGWENTLAGFQAQFYFVLLFSVISLWCLVTQTPFSVTWWLGMACSVLAFFSFASGIFVLGAAAFISLMVYLKALRRTGTQLAAVVLLSALFLLGVKFTPTLQHQAIYKAHSVDELYYSIISVFGWPLTRNLIAALLCNVPAIIFTVNMLRKRAPATDYKWFLTAVVIWSFAQCLSIAYGRATVNRSPRYLDTFTMGMLANFVCLLSIVQGLAGKRRTWAVMCVLSWTAILITSLVIRGGKLLPGELAIKRAIGNLQEMHTRNFLATGDIRHLKDKPFFHIPFPDADQLSMILSTPEIRQILPGNINPLQPISVKSAPAGTFTVNGHSNLTPSRSDTTLGSFQMTGDGNEAIGTLSIQFANNKTCEVQFDVAGYPLNDSMKLAIEQNGQLSPVSLKENPEEDWKTVYAKVNKGPFSITLTDSSRTAWMAVSMPSVAGSLDRLIDKLLSRYYLFIGLGLAILTVLITGRISARMD